MLFELNNYVNHTMLFPHTTDPHYHLFLLFRFFIKDYSDDIIHHRRHHVIGLLQYASYCYSCSYNAGSRVAIHLPYSDSFDLDWFKEVSTTTRYFVSITHVQVCV